jgi:hypothetical protein
MQTVSAHDMPNEITRRVGMLQRKSFSFTGKMRKAKDLYL